MLLARIIIDVAPAKYAEATEPHVAVESKHRPTNAQAQLPSPRTGQGLGRFAKSCKRVPSVVLYNPYQFMRMLAAGYRSH